jgi:NAD-dependent deacetylase sirtuin 5
MGPSSDITAFQEALAEAKNIIILSGAGLSAPSGQQYPKPDQVPDKLCLLIYSQKAVKYSARTTFQEDPSGSWQFYSYRRTLWVSARAPIEPDAEDRDSNIAEPSRRIQTQDI